MHYRPDRLRRFYQYVQRVFAFQHHANQLNDFREAPDIPTASVFETLFLGFVLHLPSLKALAFEMAQGNVRKLVKGIAWKEDVLVHGKRMYWFEMAQGNVRKVLRNRCDFCINSLRYGTHQFEIETLDAMLVR